MSEQLCWFKADEEAPWLRGRFQAWGQSGEQVCDYWYAQPVAIVEDVVTGRVFVVDLKYFTFGQRPADDA